MAAFIQSSLIRKILCRLCPLAILLISVLATPVNGQVDITGFIRNYNAIQHSQDNEILIGRNRVRLDLGKSFSMGDISISGDVQNLYSASSDSLRFTLREAYVDLYFKNSDLRLGKQMLVWGRAEGTFITDLLTPVDLSEFLTQDFADIRQGVTALNYTYYLGSDFVQLVVNPVFNPNPIPAPDSRWFPRQIIPTTINTRYTERDDEAGLSDVQLAARYGFRSNLNFDLDLNLLYWHYPNPTYAKDLSISINQPGGVLELTETYSQSFIAAYSGTLQLFDKLLVTSESAYYQRRSFDYLSSELRDLNIQDPTLFEQLQIAQIFAQIEDGFIKEKPFLVSMIGLQYELFDFTISTQFVNEHILKFDSEILQEQNYYYSTLLLQRSLQRDKFLFRFFGRYNYNNDDFWLNPELTYSGIDSFEATIGSQLFGGKESDPFYGHLSFSSFESNSFSYLKLSAYF
ncbi:hypothetical protein G3570_06220 [Balneolaceae bacterium YR4-1]|uniref:Uncharacterized protein n=1 Tax=Halalkalibaculum roseum TaxID=2709311 RepID=A0A6M1SMG3_9BACT|nr:DUF1302 family protein [Halalkalibaculum roseum]NGP76219.1 hypothetical protein [Halalkalibaculum roseum]